MQDSYAPRARSVALALLVCTACGTGEVVTGRWDGGGGNGGSGAGGGAGSDGAGGSGGLAACTPGEMVCDGINVRTCGPSGKPEGPVVESCGGGVACSAGRCTSPACSAAEAKRTFVGCRFYTNDVDNTSFDDPFRFTIVVGNSDPSLTASIKLETKSTGSWAVKKTATIKPGEMTIFPLGDSHKEGTGRFPAWAYRLTSDVPIAAYAFNSDDQLPNPQKSESTGGTMLIPAHVLGRSYLGMSADMPAGGYTSHSGATPAQIVVIGARDGTTVTVSPKVDIKAGGGVPAIAAGTSYIVMLDEGDVLQLQTAKVGDGVTGSEIRADRPVAVFSGNVCAADGKGVGWVSDPCDMTLEQLIPVEAWGKSYVASKVATAKPALAAGSPCMENMPTNVWRVLASEDDTTVGFDHDPAISGLPAGPVKLARGQFQELKVTGTASRPGDFFVSADKPILIAQFLPCEPSMGLAVSAEQLLQDFLFLAPSFFANQIAVTRKAGQPVKLDERPVGDALFVPAGGGFEVARIDLPDCLGSLASCVHRISGTDIGVAVRGMDTYCSYLYAGGMGIKCINRTAGCM